MSTDAKVFAYVGNYTRLAPYPRGHADGINVYSLDPSSGAMTLIQTVQGAINPTFLALDSTKRRLYAVNAVPEIDGHSGGAISAYAVDPLSGRLTYLNRQSSGGPGPCHVTVEPTGAFVLATNYAGGSVVMLPILAGGSLGAATDFIQHSGFSVYPGRQEGPHAHSVNIDPANRLAIVCDLGMDKLMLYRLDLGRGKLLANAEPWVQTRPGAGPRHLAFHPNGRVVYVINELDSTMSVYSYDAERGQLAELQALSTLPPGYSGVTWTAEVCVSPDGAFVYGSNRGHDSIAIFAVDAATGLLTYAGCEPSGGKIPRNFTLSADGKLMLVANQDSDNIVAFAVDKATGLLTPTGAVTSSPSPVCVKLVVSRSRE
jgi:6-phosphogluconolactonase